MQFGNVNYGLGIDRTPGGFIGHNGAIPGYQSFMGYQPDTHLTIIVLANLQLAPNTYLDDGLPADSWPGPSAGWSLPAAEPHSPVCPSIDSRIRSAWPLCRAYSSIMWTRIQRRLGARPSSHARRAG
jgi:Beta-lactamase